MQVPQSSVPPQPSAIVPQLAPLAPQVVCVQLVPHLLGMPPPPQLAGAVQLPQSRMPPQPSATGPQFAPMPTQVLGVQVAGGGGAPTETQAERSKIMNSSTFSWAVSGPVEQ